MLALFCNAVALGPGQWPRHGTQTNPVLCYIAATVRTVGGKRMSTLSRDEFDGSSGSDKTTHLFHRDNDLECLEAPMVRDIQSLKVRSQSAEEVIQCSTVVLCTK